MSQSTKSNSLTLNLRRVRYSLRTDVNTGGLSVVVPKSCAANGTKVDFTTDMASKRTKGGKVSNG